MTPNTVPNGVIATVSVTLAGGSDAPVTISDSLGASLTGDAVVVTASGGLVSATPVVASTHDQWSYGYGDQRIGSDDQLDH